MNKMPRVMIVFGLVATEAEADYLVRKHQSDQIVANGTERNTTRQTGMEVDADGNIEVSEHPPHFVRKHQVLTMGQVDADGSVMISASLVDSTAQQTSIKEVRAHGNAEISKHTVDTRRELLPNIVRKPQGSTTGQTGGSGTYMMSDGLVDFMPQRSERIVRKATEGHVGTDPSPELEAAARGELERNSFYQLDIAKKPKFTTTASGTATKPETLSMIPIEEKEEEEKEEAKELQLRQTLEKFQKLPTSSSTPSTDGTPKPETEPVQSNAIPTWCTDEPDEWMKSKGKTCTTWTWGVDQCRRCNTTNFWIRNKYCQYSCFLAGCGYDGDDCNGPAPTPAPTPSPPTSEPTPEPSPKPTPEPTPETSSEPTPEPTPEPSPEPTLEPTSEPTPEPTPIPTPSPTPEPTLEPTSKPSAKPTPVPTQEPTPAPSPQPTPAPSSEPTPEPTSEPTPAPTFSPTPPPTPEPTPKPSPQPTPGPSSGPTPAPTSEPTPVPAPPPTPAPSPAPTTEPTLDPTSEPTPEPEPVPEPTLPPSTWCTDTPPNYMVSSGKSCATAWDVVNCRRCNTYDSWVLNKYCQYSCFVAGCGYDGDDCHEPAPMPQTPDPTQSPTPVPTPEITFEPTSDSSEASAFGSWPQTDVTKYSLSKKLVIDTYQPAFDGTAQPQKSKCPWWNSQGAATTLTGDAVAVLAMGVTESSKGHLHLGAGRYVVTGNLDLNTKSLVISSDATLILQPKAMLTAGEIVVNGELLIGSSSCEFQTYDRATITLAGAKSASRTLYNHDHGMKGIVVTQGGRLMMFGIRPMPTWTRLSATAQAGDTTLKLKHRVNWARGDTLVITTTVWIDEKEDHQNEVRTIASVSFTDTVQSVTLTQALNFTHYGGVEYQAEVGLLSRAISIQGDSQSDDDNFGGHVMCMLGSQCQVQGVHLYRMGQMNVMGRYPLHFHRMGDVQQTSFYTHNAIEHSFFRAVSIHGTSNASIEYNVAYDISGHAIYLEDGIEEDNEINFNLVAFVHVIGRDGVLAADYIDPNRNKKGGYSGIGNHQGVQHILSCPVDDVDCASETSALVSPDVAASGFYCTNAHNTWIGNAASGGFSGFIFPSLPYVLGKSYESNKDFVPLSRSMKVFDGNTAHSSGRLWETNGGCMYIGGAIVNDPLGSERYVYTYGRALQDEYVHSGTDKYGNTVAGMDRKIIKRALPEIQYNIKNLRVSICKLGFLFWGAKGTVPLPYSLNERFEAHDVFKAAHLMGVASINGATFTGHTPNVRGPVSEFGSSQPPKSAHLFEQYDLGMATVLKDVHCRGVYALGDDSDAGDVCIKDVTRSSTINSIMMLSGFTVDDSVDQSLWFRHVAIDAIQGKRQSVQQHCNVRNSLGYFTRMTPTVINGVRFPGPWNSPCGSTPENCALDCGGTSYSSQIVVVEVEDNSLKSLGSNFEEGALLGGEDTSSETGGSSTSTNAWWKLDYRCLQKFNESPYSGGFWVCPRQPMGAEFGTRTVVNVLMFDVGQYVIDNDGKGFLGGDRLPQQGGAEPNPWAVSGTVYHFGQPSRRLQVNKGLAQVQGPCCDIGWYFKTSGDTYGTLAIHPMRMVTRVGLVFATSYDTSATLMVQECRKISNVRSCTSVPFVGSLSELKTETENSTWHTRTTSKSLQLFLKIVNVDKSAYVAIGDTMMPLRRPRDTSSNVWYEIENTGIKSSAPLDIPELLWRL